MTDWWMALTGPTPGTLGEGARRRAQTISALLLPLGLVLTVSLPLLETFPRQCATLSLVISAVAYGCVRAGHEVLAGLLTVAACLVLPWWGMFTPEPDTLPFAEIMWLMLSVMLGGLSLDRRWLVGVSGVVVVGTAVVMAHGGIPTRSIQTLCGFLVLVSLLSLLSVSILERGEAQLAERAAALQAANIQIKEAQAQLVHAGKMSALGELSAAVAHEINNPLTVVMMHSALLQQSITDEDHQEQLADIIEATRRCQGITRGLLDFGRGSGGGKRQMDLAEVAAGTLALVQHHLSLMGATIEVRLAEGMMVEADPDQLGQVILNLLTNAGHAVESGGRISLTGGRDARGVWLCIEDDGCGIPAENLERVFEPFFTTRDTGKGTGLGLAISYGIVSQYGGRITVESTEGEGARFTVWLPLPG